MSKTKITIFIIKHFYLHAHTFTFSLEIEKEYKFSHKFKNVCRYFFALKRSVLVYTAIVLIILELCWTHFGLTILNNQFIFYFRTQNFYFSHYFLPLFVHLHNRVNMLQNTYF